MSESARHAHDRVSPASSGESTAADVIIVGAGHNGLVAATFLARAGLRVMVLERADVIGGATRTETPFAKAPELKVSSGAYLLGVMPPELIAKLGANVPVLRRDPHYFLPTLDGRYLLFGSDQEAMRHQFTAFFSEQDWRANQAMQAELSQLREDIAPAWLAEPLSLEETAERYIRSALRQRFVDLVRQPAERYIQRFDFKSELLIAMYAVTDGFSGLSGSIGSPGTGHNFLVHNMCRLPHADGTWMVARGGMGAIAAEFARCAIAAGATIRTGARVAKILTSDGRAEGVALQNGEALRARVVLTNADPFTTRELVGDDAFPAEFTTKLDGLVRTGTTMKVNMALDRLPTFSCLPEDRGQHRGTMHLLPQGNDILGQLRRGFDAVQRGELDPTPTIEWYIHTTVDPSLQDPQGRHNGAFFVQWVPYELRGTTWEQEQDKYVDRLIDIAEQFAPGIRSHIIDTFPLTPKGIERHFGIRYGHIHHVDNTFAFDERAPYAWPVEGLYSCSAGTHPAGSVIGAAGHNAAQLVLRNLGVRSAP